MNNDEADLTPKTRREVLMCRDAFDKACKACVDHFGWEYNAPRYASWPGSRTLAEMTYPLPRVTRPRPVRINGTGRWIRLQGGTELQESLDGRSWLGGVIMRDVDDDTRLALIEVLTNPVETVEEDA